MKRRRYLNENIRRQNWNTRFVEQYADMETSEDVVRCIMDALQSTPAIEALANAMDNYLDPQEAFSTKTAQMLMDAISEEVLNAFES